MLAGRSVAEVKMSKCGELDVRREDPLDALARIPAIERSVMSGGGRFGDAIRHGGLACAGSRRPRSFAACGD